MYINLYEQFEDSSILFVNSEPKTFVSLFLW